MQSHPHPFASIRTFRRWRWSRICLFPAAFVVACMSVLVVGLTHGVGPSAAPEAAPASQLALWSALVAVALMSIHLWYLALMARSLIYAHPIEQNLGGTPYVFLLISLAYVLAASGAYLPEAMAHREAIGAALDSAVYGLFSLAYGLLFTHGIRTLPTGLGMMPRASFSTRYFLVVDAVFCVSFLVMIFVPVEIGPLHVGGLAINVRAKDVLILTSVIVYSISTLVIEIVVLLFEKNRAYENYLSHVRLVPGESDGLRGVAETVGLRSVWVEFGGGSGRHLLETLRLLYPDARPPLRALYLFDRESVVQRATHRHLVDTLTGAGVRLERIGDRKAIARILKTEAEVVLISHQFYDPPAVERIIADIAGLRVGSCVIIRVSGTTGMFRAIGMYDSGRLVAPTSHHVVSEVGIRELCRRHGFRTVHRCRIAQYYRIADQDATANLARWCDIRYGQHAGDAIREYVGTLADRGVQVLPDDDDVYILRKEEA